MSVEEIDDPTFLSHYIQRNDVRMLVASLRTLRFDCSNGETSTT